MAEPGRLRLRDDRLVVEAAGGRIIAEIEPDDHMTIDKTGQLMASFMEAQYPRGTKLEGRIGVSWFQVVGEGRGAIDAQAIDVEVVQDPPQPRPQIGPPDDA